MLEDAAGIRRVVIACGYVDLRKGIDGLSMIIGDRYHQNPFEKAEIQKTCFLGWKSEKNRRSGKTPCIAAEVTVCFLA